MARQNKLTGAIAVCALIVVLALLVLQPAPRVAALTCSEHYVEENPTMDDYDACLAEQDQECFASFTTCENEDGDVTTVMQCVRYDQVFVGQMSCPIQESIDDVTEAYEEDSEVVAFEEALAETEDIFDDYADETCNENFDSCIGCRDSEGTTTFCYSEIINAAVHLDAMPSLAAVVALWSVCAMWCQLS